MRYSHKQYNEGDQDEEANCQSNYERWRHRKASMLALVGWRQRVPRAKRNTAGNTIKIGVNMELSGAVAGYGEQQKQGIELAVKQINAAGGIKVGKY